MVSVTLGGRPRTLKFDFETVETAEAALGQPFRAVVLSHRGFTIDQIVRIFWAILSREDKTITVQKVRTWVKAAATEGGTSLLAMETAILDAALATDLIIPQGEATAAEGEDGAADPPTAAAAANGSAS